MSKFVGGVVVGVFVGALAVEVLNRLQPELLRNVEHRARKVVDDLGDVIARGRSAVRSQVGQDIPDAGY